MAIGNIICNYRHYSLYSDANTSIIILNGDIFIDEAKCTILRVHCNKNTHNTKNLLDGKCKRRQGNMVGLFGSGG